MEQAFLQCRIFHRCKEEDHWWRTASTVISLTLWLVIENLTIVAGCLPTIGLLVSYNCDSKEEVIFVTLGFFFLFFNSFAVEVWMFSFQVTS